MLGNCQVQLDKHGEREGEKEREKENEQHRRHLTLKVNASDAIRRSMPAATQLTSPARPAYGQKQQQ